MSAGLMVPYRRTRVLRVCVLLTTRSVESTRELVYSGVVVIGVCTVRVIVRPTTEGAGNARDCCAHRPAHTVGGDGGGGDPGPVLCIQATCDQQRGRHQERSVGPGTYRVPQDIGAGADLALDQTGCELAEVAKHIFTIARTRLRISGRPSRRPLRRPNSSRASKVEVRCAFRN